MLLLYWLSLYAAAAKTSSFLKSLDKHFLIVFDTLIQLNRYLCQVAEDRPF